MTDRPTLARPNVRNVLRVRSWVTIATLGALLMSILAGPWITNSGAQSGPVRTPATPRPPLVTLSTATYIQGGSIDGTPQATATLPTEPRQGTPVPLAPVYRTSNGFATAPESTSGYELRLYRLTITPGATFDLPQSSRWTLVVASGTVDLYSTFNGVRGSDGSSLSSGGSSSGLPAGTFQNLSDDDAVIWAIDLAVGGAPISPSATGAAFDLLGQAPLEDLTVGATVQIAFAFDAAGPVGRPLDAISRVTQPDAPGSVPAGLVYGVQGSMSIEGPAGTEPIPVGAGQAVSIADLTGRSITGPVQQAPDAPNAYVVVSAQEQVPRPGPLGTPGVPLPIETTITATPVLSSSPAVGELVTCDAEPRTVEELQGAIDQIYATPSLVTDPFGRSARPQAGTGIPADDATIAAIQATLQEYFVCSANGDLARAFGLNSDGYLSFILGYTVSDLAQLTGFATALPVSTGVPEEIVLSDAELFPDGRVGALAYTNGGTTYVTFVSAEDGSWLIDVVDLESGLINLPTTMFDATPTP